MRWSAVGSALMDFFFGVKDLHNCLFVGHFPLDLSLSFVFPTYILCR